MSTAETTDGRGDCRLRTFFNPWKWATNEGRRKEDGKAASTRSFALARGHGHSNFAINFASIRHAPSQKGKLVFHVTSAAANGMDVATGAAATDGRKSALSEGNFWAMRKRTKSPLLQLLLLLLLRWNFRVRVHKSRGRRRRRHLGFLPFLPLPPSSLPTSKLRR